MAANMKIDEAFAARKTVAALAPDAKAPLLASPATSDGATSLAASQKAAMSRSHGTAAVTEDSQQGTRVLESTAAAAKQISCASNMPVRRPFL